jgi:spore coat polysaccharide biosynthesis predicted glycosyltransferase SpsG
VLAALAPGDVLVSDTRALDGPALAAVAEHGAVHVVVDDLGRGPESWPCDVVVNPNLGASPSSYPGARAVLAGARFALLRREVREAAARRGPSRRDASGLLLCLGGGDAVWRRPATPAIADALAGLGLELRVAAPAGLGTVPPETLPAQLAWADLAVLSAGVVKYEAAACGVPMLLTAAAPDQHGLPEAFAGAGAAVALPPLGVLSPAEAAREAGALAADAERRARLAEAARDLCDGRGVERVADAVLGA